MDAAAAAIYALQAVGIYYTCQFLYYLYHRFVHMPIAGPLYRMHHIGHHKVKFPLRSLRALSYGQTSSTDEAASASNGWFETGGELVFGVPAILSWVLAFKFLPTPTAIIIIVVELYVMISGDILHSSFHLYDDAVAHPESLSIHRWMVSQPWFRSYQHLHDIHHAKTGTNFGFGDFTMDRLFGTFCAETPAFLSHPPAKSSS
eukprot:m.239184 g.239184  ORF g.239184 m.239184 type:complete len:203 (+) comp13442_c0_seq1:76-684(+)